MRKNTGTLETVTIDAPRRGGDAPDPIWHLTIALHPRAELVGRSAPLIAAGELIAGRHADWLGAGTFHDPRVSRSHARFVLGDGGSLTVEDQGSHNGTLVGGRRVERRELVSGDVVGIGGVLLLAHRAPRGRSQLDLEHQTWARSAEPVAILGEPGSGRTRLAARLHAIGERRGRILTVTAASLGDDLVLTTLCGNEAGAYPGAITARPGLLEEADQGTLVVDGLEAVRPALAAALSDFLDRGAVSRVGASERRQLDVKVIGIGASVPSTLSSRFGLAVLRVPPLRERKEDIPALALAAGSSIDERLMRALLAHDWPGNVRELQALIASARLAQRDERPLALTPDLAAALGAERALVESSIGTGKIAIARSGAFLVTATGERVELTTRKSLRAIVAALVDASRATDAPPLTVEALFAIGWPGERIAAAAAATRVHTAVSTLRREGLKELLHRDPRGYHLGPPGAWEILEG